MSKTEAVTVAKTKPQKDFWDILSILSSLFIPIVGLVVGQWLTAEQKKANEITKQADRLSLLIRHLASDNERERRIAVDVSKFLATKGQLPQEIVPAIINMADTDSGADVAKAASEVLASVEKNDRRTGLAIRESALKVPARLYVHINKEDQRSMAARLTRQLLDMAGNADLKVPGITLVNGPGRPELRYFKNDDKGDADELARALKGLGIPVIAINFADRIPNASQIRPRHFELWLGDDHAE